jgi:predicted acylesterase/phospholipase RssA
MSKNKKLKKRGFVMTGGGAKGLYEAGVIHAFHITGMEFDVITGSSIGAMNSIFFAEYLYRKRQLNPELRGDYTRAVEEMDDMVKAFHHAWLTMPDARIVDDSEEGPLGQVVDDLKNFDISLPQLVEL